jgi:hypothetical protein
MCSGGLFGGGSVPSAPAPVPAPAIPTLTAPIEADASSARAAEDERKRRAAASGRSDTVLTSGTGLTNPAQTTGKTLLGQ